MDLLVTYSILTIVRDRKTNINSLLDIYQDLCESILADNFFSSSGAGLIKDIREGFEQKFELSVPYPTLKILLTNIRRSYPDNFVLHEDYSFQFEPNEFASLRKDIKEETTKIIELREYYEYLCQDIGIKDWLEFEFFIEINKRELLAFLNRQDYEVAERPEFKVIETLMSIPEFKERIERMILGALISSYMDLKIEQGFEKKTLVLDTNFVISLFDLHSEISKTTCDEIISAAKRFAFKVQVLQVTVEEIKNLLKKKAKLIRQIPLCRAQNPNSIDHGCYRRKMSGRDLMLYENKVVKILKEYQIEVISRSKYNISEADLNKSQIYQKLSKRPFNQDGIRHDTIVMEYVSQLRGSNDAEFRDTKALFVTDSHGYVENRINISTKLPYMIRAEELVNILWLLNPTAGSKITHIMISRVFSSFLEKRLPSKETLAQLDERIQSMEGLLIDQDDCRDIMVNLAVIDGRQLTQLIENNDDEIFSSQMAELAQQARKRKLMEEQDEQARIQSLIDKIKEKYEAEVVALTLDKDQATQKLKLENFNQLNKVKSDSDSVRLREKVSSLSALRGRDQEEKEKLESDLMQPETRVDRIQFLIKRVVLFLLVPIVGLVTFLIILPHWNFLEPILWGVNFLIIIVIALVPTIGKSINPDLAFERIAKRICHQDARRIESNRPRINILQKRIDESNNEIEDIII